MDNQLGGKLVREGLISEETLETALARQKVHGGRIGQNLIALGHLDEETLQKFFRRNPSIPLTISDTGIDASQIADLLMKHILFMGDFKIADLAERLQAFPFGS